MEDALQCFTSERRQVHGVVHLQRWQFLWVGRVRELRDMRCRAKKCLRLCQPASEAQGFLQSFNDLPSVEGIILPVNVESLERWGEATVSFGDSRSRQLTP